MIKKKLLLVDDDSDDTELFSEAVSEVDSSVLCHCASLERVKGNQRLKDIPVIIYTTSSTRSDLLHARTSGALCFVTKPANYGRLKKILEIVISYMEKDALGGVCDAVHSYLGGAN
jgi:DNA-binding NarL/FixJ family response regulator